MEIRLLVYIALGYWAAGETIYKNKVLISTKIDAIFFRKTAYRVFAWIYFDTNSGN